MSEPLVLREDHGPIIVLTLNRPEKRNALSRALIAALSDAIDQVAAEPGPRALILTGNGPAFCSGMDLKEAAEIGTHAEAEKQAVADLQAIAHLINQIHIFPRPTIAALNGDALAGGAGLALACDFVIADDAAHLGYPEVRRGLVAAVALYDLVRQAGDRRARELLLTGAPIPAALAEDWGLINRVAPKGQSLDDALNLARALLAAGPHAVTTTKRLLDEATGRPPDLRGAAAVSASVRIGDEAIEGMRSFLEKRQPRWYTQA
ncbi:MAG: enoyl-CoA hydratase/isomerase family protein [Isosphaeraceae bacterium]|nr:enoyl-CoA hydratase/isomerase family protein [Isosphaeraceae bacterium]